ncbi:MAG TPA: FecR family protein [Chitinivibrionales bacterium]|nr:FecR family protein [Chitinivibrionales bacterium]
MDCLKQSQILEYCRGNKSAPFEEHLADCAACREKLLAVIAGENPENKVPQELVDKTVDAIILKAQTLHRKEAAFKSHEYSFPASSIYKFAIAAGIIAALVCGYFLVKGPFNDYASINFRHVSPSVKSGKYGPENNTALPETVVVRNGSDQKKNMVLVFDSVNIRVGKVPVKKDREALIRLGGKTGIEAGPAAVINVKSRTDTTVLVELTKGTALFTVEKNKFRQFVVQTPTVRIVAVGTVFSVIADSVYAMVNVVEGAVKLEHERRPSITAMLKQGDGAFANRDSIINVMIQNSQMLRVREKFLRDYIEGALSRPGSGTLPGSSGESHMMPEDVKGANKTE